MRAGVTALLVPLLLQACLWPEPVNLEPPPTATDSPVSIEDAQPSSHEVNVALDSQNTCVAVVGLPQVNSPNGLQVYARFYLNYQESDQIAGQVLTIGQTTDLKLVQSAQNPTVFTLPKYALALQPYADVLQPLGPNIPSNQLWVFVSDGFASDPNQPTPTNGHSVAQQSWQLTFDPACTYLP